MANLSVTLLKSGISLTSFFSMESIARALMSHGVSQEGLDPLQSKEAPLGFSCCHGHGDEDVE